jgi:hypothetical protein
MFNDSLIFLMWVACTWAIVNIFIGIRDRLEQTTNELEDRLRDKINEIVHCVSQEQHGDVIYWFDHDDGEFLAQGRTQQELIDVVKHRYPNHVFFLEHNQILSSPTWEPRPSPVALVLDKLD